jgi:hypothetical protein
MSYLLREVLLGALGIESDLIWGTSKHELSAVDLNLIPPSAGALISKISDLGLVYRMLEESTASQQMNSFCQALYDSLENYLDQYRSTILKADAEITSGLLTTLTGLVAYVEPFQHELQFVGRILPPLIAASPLDMLNKMHEYVVVSPPSIASKLSAFENALHHVAINQLNGFLFYHQPLPEIFEPSKTTSKIQYARSLTVTFIPHQLAELLLLIVTVADHCTDLFKDTDPPEFDQLMPWIALMARTSSELLSARLSELWPNYFRTLKSICLLGRFDLVKTLAQKTLQPFVSAYDLNVLLAQLSPDCKATLEIAPTGVQIHSKLEPPLDLIVTADHQAVISEIFKLFMKLAVAEESIGRIWVSSRRMSRVCLFVNLLSQILGVIKEYIVFVVIVPALARIEKAGSGITDFLKFQGEFALFVVQLATLFPASNPEFQNAVGLFTDKTAEMRDLFIGKELITKMTEEQILQVIGDLGRDLVVGVTQIGRLLNIGEENGINVAPRIDKLVQCARHFVQ